MNETEYIKKIKDIEELRTLLTRYGRRLAVDSNVIQYHLTTAERDLLICMLCKAEASLAHPSLREQIKRWWKSK